MEKVTRGPVIIFRGGRILRGSHGFSGVKEGGGDQSSPTEFKGGRLQKMDFHLTSNEGGGVGGGQINFIVTKPNTLGTPPPPLPQK